MTGETRNNRVVAFLSDREFRTLKQIARDEGLPIGTAVYMILARSLARKRK